MNNEISKIMRPIKVLVGLMLLSAVAYYILAHWEGRDVTLLRCLYMVTITISTIGYEDLLNVKESTVLTVFTIFTIIAYMVVVAYTISNFTAFLVEGRLRKYFEYLKLRKRISKMDSHYIICGIKDLGVFVAEELHATRRGFVIIDSDRAALEALQKTIPELAYVEGDATDDTILEEAGIGRAKGLVACLDNDKENLYLILAARDLNPKLQLASSFKSLSARKKLLKAGAAHLVCPDRIGGMRIASELLRPQVVSFLDGMLHSKTDTGLRVEQVIVGGNSEFVGKSFGEFYDKCGVLIISYASEISHKSDFKHNPGADIKFEKGMAVLFIATPEQRQKVEGILS